MNSKQVNDDNFEVAEDEETQSKTKVSGESKDLKEETNNSMFVNNKNV